MDKPICSTCDDTHTVRTDEGWQPCNDCPVPCLSCREGISAYCAETPCPCECHRKEQPRGPELLRKVAALSEQSAQELLARAQQESIALGCQLDHEAEARRILALGEDYAARVALKVLTDLGAKQVGFLLTVPEPPMPLCADCKEVPALTGGYCYVCAEGRGLWEEDQRATKCWCCGPGCPEHEEEET